MFPRRTGDPFLGGGSPRDGARARGPDFSRTREESETELRERDR